MRVHNRCLDVACVIYGAAYHWDYVQNLNAMITRNIDSDVRFHVFTEPTRLVPAPFVRHDLIEWPSAANLRAWWYKMQMFDPRHGLNGPLLYLDLDVVITGDLDWIAQLDQTAFWTIRDFRYLWRPSWKGMNSSFLYWNPARYAQVWKIFCEKPVSHWAKQFPGDQDFLTHYVPGTDIRFVDQDIVRSYRWQIKDGGMDPVTRQYRRPGAGAVIPASCRIMVFHGSPKPADVADMTVLSLWNHK